MDIEHGHVVPRADGLKARCGGPSICKKCALELTKQAQREREAEDDERRRQEDERRAALADVDTTSSPFVMDIPSAFEPGPPPDSGGSYDGGGGDSGGGGSSGDF